MHDKTKFERGQEMLDTLISKLQRDRTEAAITQLRVQWGKMYGLTSNDRFTRLSTAVLKRSLCVGVAFWR